MITSMMGRMADAEKLSIPQLQMAIKNGTIPAYVGVPLLQDKVKQTQQAKQAQPAPAQPPIAQQVMAEAEGIDSVPSNLPVQSMNDGGIVAFADGGDAEDFDQEEYEDQIAEEEYARAIEDRLNAAEEGPSGRAPSSKKKIHSTPEVNVVEGGIKPPAGDFYKNMYATLRQKAEEMGFKNPDAIARVGAAQSALETGHGKSLAGGNNYFGIKGGNNKQRTQEFDPSTGKMYTANESFRTYGGMEDSAADYLRLMQNPRYKNVAMAATPEEAIAHQSRSGYATDPQYGAKLASIHRANMAEGGIARLNKGGVPRFNGETGSVPSYDPMGNYIGGNENSADGSAAKRQPPKNFRFNNPLSPKVGEWIEDKFNLLEKTNQDLLPRNLPFLPSSPKPNVLNYEYGTGSAPSSIGVDEASPFALDTTELDRLTRRYPAANATGNRMAEYEPSTGQASGVERLLPDNASPAQSSTKLKSDYDLFREDMLAQREALKQQKAEDRYMALISAGLGMMGGTSPNAMANIGQGAQAGVAYAAQAGKQRAAENAALNKSLMTGQRYKSMDEYQRAALADRAAGRADLIAEKGEDRLSREAIKSEELERNRERDIGTLITNGSARATAELKAKFPNPDLLSDKDKIAYKQEETRLYTQYVAPFIKAQNQMLQRRYPDLFQDESSVRPAPTTNRVKLGNL